MIDRMSDSPQRRPEAAMQEMLGLAQAPSIIPV